MGPLVPATYCAHTDGNLEMHKPSISALFIASFSLSLIVGCSDEAAVVQPKVAENDVVPSQSKASILSGLSHRRIVASREFVS